MPAPNPNISAVRPNSLFMVSAANPTLTRSKKATRKHRIRNGMRRHAALRDARSAAPSETFKSAVFIQKRPSRKLLWRPDWLSLRPDARGLDNRPPFLNLGLLQV